MTSPRSMFTEAIEDHLALKKQNAHLNDEMPTGRFGVGDPLDRYPGGPVKPALGSDLAGEAAASTDTGEGTAQGAASTPTTAMAAAAEAAAMAGGAAGGHVFEGEFRRPLEPLNGMTPMLSLVEDIDDEELQSARAATAVLAPVIDEAASVLRFPGGVGPRPQQDAARAASAVVDAESTGEQPVIVIDADEPLAPAGIPAARAPRQLDSRTGVRRPSFFGLRRRRKGGDDEPQGGGWFSDAPKDFNWDD